LNEEGNTLETGFKRIYYKRRNPKVF